MTTRKLGRIRPAAPPACLRFGAYLSAAAQVTPPPESVDLAPKAMAAIQRMYLNDRFGDCVIAGAAHAVGVWSGNDTGIPVLATDQEVYSAYVGICGPNDSGCSVSRVLDVQRVYGIRFGGQLHKIDGDVAVNHVDQVEVKTALFVFGNLKIGMLLTQKWVDSQEGDVWVDDDSPVLRNDDGSPAGHNVEAIGYGPQGLKIATWGGTRWIDWGVVASRAWLDEMYCPLSPDWYNSDRLAPNGIDATALKLDLGKLAHGMPIELPPSPVPPTPIPIPPPPKPIGLADVLKIIADLIAALLKGNPH